MKRLSMTVIRKANALRKKGLTLKQISEWLFAHNYTETRLYEGTLCSAINRNFPRSRIYKAKKAKSITKQKTIAEALYGKTEEEIKKEKTQVKSEVKAEPYTPLQQLDDFDKGALLHAVFRSKVSDAAKVLIVKQMVGICD